MAQRYLAVTREKGKNFLTFVDKQRGIFIKGDLERQDVIVRKIYLKIIGASETSEKE